MSIDVPRAARPPAAPAAPAAPAGTARSVRRIKISSLDRSWLGATTSAVAGPLDLPSVPELRRALVQIGSAGPRTRAGLRLSADERWWVDDPDGLVAWADEVIAAGAVPAQVDPDAGPDALVAALATYGRRLDPRPLQVRVVGDHLVLAIRHGLGDARLLLALVSGLVSTARTGELPDWTTETGIEHPLRTAVRSFFGSRQRAGALVRERWSARGARSAVAGPPRTPSVAWTPDPALVFARGTDAGRRELLAWKKTQAPDASMAALGLAASRAALREVGVPVTDSTLMVYDLRRYLPHRQPVAGNFIAGIDLRPTDPDGVDAISTAIEQAGDLGRPLAALLVGQLVGQVVGPVGQVAGRVRRLVPRNGARRPESVPAQPTAWPAYNFMGRQMAVERMPWSGEPAVRRFAAQVDPATPEGISVCLIQVGGGLQYSLSFHAGVFRRDLVQRAATLAATEPIRLLERHVG